jgi:hypothetical protein
MTFYILDSNTDDINLDMTNYSTVSYYLQENTKMPSMIISSRKVNIVQPKKSLYYTLHSVKVVSKALIHKLIKSLLGYQG